MMKPKIERLTTKEKMLQNGYVPLTKKALLNLISNTTVWGDYEYSGHRKYKTFMDANGKMEAKNDWGSHVFGEWRVEEDGCLTVKWQGYWEDWTAIAFQVEREIKFYNIEDGQWQTTFYNIEQGRQDLEVTEASI